MKVRRGRAKAAPGHCDTPDSPRALNPTNCPLSPGEAKPQILGRFQVTPTKDLAAMSLVPGSSEGEQHSMEPAASGSPLPAAPDTRGSSSSDLDSVLEIVEQDPEAEEVLAEEGTVAAAESDREGPGEDGGESAPQAVINQVWLSYSRSLSYLSSDDTESEDEEIWEELQNLRQK